MINERDLLLGLIEIVESVRPKLPTGVAATHLLEIDIFLENHADDIAAVCNPACIHPGIDVFNASRAVSDTLDEIAASLKVAPYQVVERVQQLISQRDELLEVAKQ
jgi:hypothetical protein